MEDTEYFYQKKRGVKKLIFGGLLILLGVLFLGFNVGWLPPEYKGVIFSWPMVLIAIGILNFSERCSWITGLLFTTVGVIFLLPKIPGSGVPSIETVFWPVMLIAAGILVMTKKYRHRNHHHKWRRYRFDPEKKTEDGFIYEHSVFSGSERIIPPGEFKGGRIEIIFGGSEIDLTKCTLAPGKNILELECIFGGVEIKVPPDWKISVEISPVMGGFVDKRKVFNVDNDSGSELLIKGTVVFGGGEIKS